MKILVIQIARLGDILMSWPAMRALRRQYPNAEIHLLVRPRFEAATIGLTAVDRVRTLPTQDILEPLLRAHPSDGEALGRVEFYLQGLRAEKYDEVINLSFSPLSSWITKAISSPTATIKGYSRTTDGWLKIVDSVSSFFYAQVGPGRANRIHLSDLFATLMEVDLEPSDWQAPDLDVKDFGVRGRSIVLHPGASEAHKTIPAFLWGRVVKRIHDLHPQCPIVIIGSAEEGRLANEIRANAGDAVIIDLTGQTRFQDLYGICRRAQVVIGGDSVALHVASLTGTPCLNVSLGQVNFWETGPRAAGSVVLRVGSIDQLSSENVAQALSCMIEGRVPESAMIAQAGVPAFAGPLEAHGEFSWQLIQAMYLEGPFPVTDDPYFVDAVSRLREMNDVVLEQLKRLSGEDAALAALIDRADEVFQAVARIIPEASILVRWILTEKTRVPPGTKDQVREEIGRIHTQFARVLKLYDLDVDEGKGQGHGAL